ncbi:MAG: hypothetical protein KAH08_07695, partial [Methylococcales bacterium]|nr:hypothetical protein [Methylococcales bacterium]
YGLQVAALAGVPRGVIEQAKLKLHSLEKKSYQEQQLVVDDAQGDLFSEDEDHPILSLLAEINPDEMTPKEALKLLYRFKSLR